MEKLPFENIKRKVLVKKDIQTDSRYGVEPEKRDIKELLELGIVNLNKPAGPTSHQVTDYVKKIFGLKKAGHSGTLDPNVTGVLPIAFGRGTRVVQVLLKSGKEYIGLMHLHKEASLEDIQKVVIKFTGNIEQLPPIRSAVKRRLRTRKIYYLNILEVEG
ncbi:RNA-guided pseudouridylation complex pseudouridine synthase subunit Cbf5, partial [archaeon]|nr:RNA-guided pseudouridylation complex pseudouridine synthase subunit Cbf5 [archaeon]